MARSKTCSSNIVVHYVRVSCQLDAGHEGHHMHEFSSFNSHRRRSEQHHNRRLEWWNSSRSAYSERVMPATEEA